MKTPVKPHAPATQNGPIDWRVLVGWLREDGVISADEAARTVARCASAQSTLHPLERLAVVGVARTDGTLLDVEALAQWLAQHPASAGSGVRLVLSLSEGTRPLAEAVQGQMNVTLLSGPEGGRSPAEEALALSAGFVPVTLGPRVLRAETAALTALGRSASTMSSNGFILMVSFQPYSLSCGGLTVPSQPMRLINCTLIMWMCTGCWSTPLCVIFQICTSSLANRSVVGST